MIGLGKSPALKAACRGFTLFELLLVTGLLVLFTSAAILSLGVFAQGTSLTQGTSRFESLLRFARAEAANTGRRVRVSFVQATEPATNQLSRVQVTWEPQPLEEPEVFADLPRAQWGLDEVNENVGIETVKLTDPDQAGAPLESGEENAEAAEAETATAAPQPITFNPDGSCDSAEIILAARNLEDVRRVTVRVEGLTGTISSSLSTNGVDVEVDSERPTHAGDSGFVPTL